MHLQFTRIAILHLIHYSIQHGIIVISNYIIRTQFAKYLQVALTIDDFKIYANRQDQSIQQNY